MAANIKYIPTNFLEYPQTWKLEPFLTGLTVCRNLVAGKVKIPRPKIFLKSRGNSTSFGTRIDSIAPIIYYTSKLFQSPQNKPQKNV